MNTATNTLAIVKTYQWCNVV